MSNKIKSEVNMKRFFLIVLLFGANVILNAEELHLTIEKVKEIALLKNPELLAEEQVRNAANAEAMESNFNLLPKVDLTGSYTLYDPQRTISSTSTMEPLEVKDSKSYGISVSQPIFNGGKNYLGSRIKSEQAKIADASYSKERLFTLTDAESKFFAVLESSELLDIAQKDLEASNEHLRTAEMRYKLGTLSKADYIKMQAERATKEVTLIQTNNLYEISRIELANFLRIPSDYTTEELSLEVYETYLNKLKNISLEEINKLVDEIISIGIEQNPYLEMASLSKSVNKKSLQIATGEFLPSINLSYNKTWDKYNIEDEFNSQGNLMLSVSIPIFPIVDNVANLSKARYDLKQSEYSYHSIESKIKLALESSLLNLISSAKSVYSSKIALEYAEETFKQMEERFKNNVITATDLLDAEVLLTTSRNQYTTSFYDFLRAKSSLLQQMGVEAENILWSLIAG